MDIRIKPRRLCGSVSVPASKSQLHRLLICAALSNAPSTILARGVCDDVATTLGALRTLGAKIQYDNGAFFVEPISDAELEHVTVDCHESGSTLRFLLPVAAALGDGVTFVGSGKLPKRPNAQLAAALRAHGVSCTSDLLPIEISGRLRAGEFPLAGNVSSQFISGLLLAFPLLEGPSGIRLETPLESGGYVEMTREVQAMFGVQSMITPDGWSVDGKQRYAAPTQPMKAQCDWSAAAFWLCANTLGAQITLLDLSEDTKQGDFAVTQILEEMKRSCDMELDVSQIPDLVLALCIAACARRSTTRFVNCARLRFKESDRIQSTVALVRSLGGDAQTSADTIVINGCGTLHGGVVDSFGDHRIAMSAAIASVICENDVVIQNALVTDKSYPGFYEDFKALGGEFDVEQLRQ